MDRRKNKTRQTAFRLPENLLGKLKAQAEKDKRSVNKTVELLVENYLKSKTA